MDHLAMRRLLVRHTAALALMAPGRMRHQPATRQLGAYRRIPQPLLKGLFATGL